MDIEKSTYFNSESYYFNFFNYLIGRGNSEEDVDLLNQIKEKIKENLPEHINWLWLAKLFNLTINERKINLDPIEVK